MRSFLGPGDVVACPWPTYSLYDTLATIQGVEIRHSDWAQQPYAGRALEPPPCRPDLSLGFAPSCRPDPRSADAGGDSSPMVAATRS